MIDPQYVRFAFFSRFIRWLDSLKRAGKVRHFQWVLGIAWVMSPGNLALADGSRFVVSVSGMQRLDSFQIQADGKLVIQSQMNMSAKPGASCFDLTGRNLYVGCSDPNTVSVCRVESDGLTQLQSVSVPGKPSFLRLTPSGRFLIASYYQTGQVTVHRVLGEGRLSNEPIQTISIDERAHGVAIDRTGKFVFVPHTRPNCISQFRLDDSTGELRPNDPAKLQRDEGIGPRHLAFHPTLDFAYGSNEQGRSISAYRFDAAAGTLQELQTVSSVPEDYSANGSTSHVSVDPSGKFVYIANRGHGSIAAYGVDFKTGQLSFIHRAPAETAVRSFDVSPSGKYLVAAGQKSGRLVSYRVGLDGKLEKTDSLPAGKSPWWISFSPTDGLADEMHRSELVESHDRSLTLGQGSMAGEVSATSVLLQARLTKGSFLDAKGDLPGCPGVAVFEWSKNDGFRNAGRTAMQTADADRDFIVRSLLNELDPDTRYFYRVLFGVSEGGLIKGPTASFRTLPGKSVGRPVKFIVGSCMNYIKFMHGRVGKASGPITATIMDKRLGFPAFESMRKLEPEFFVGTGDIVYYDNPFRVATTTRELRKCWHEQFRFPRMIDFFRDVPTYWSKDDHDFRFNDSDNHSKKAPLPQTGIDMFHEQLPIAPFESVDRKTYRTIRVSRDLQIWLTEGRDYRSPNESSDGPSKSMWGVEQCEWIKRTLAESDAKWKLVISPTPMVGPDDGYKKDNHANLQGFRHEADAFFDWVKGNEIKNLFLVCGDRHWQYHSIHPSGVHEFAVGALNDENSRMGVLPGAEFGTDPDGLVDQRYTSPSPSGGFLQITAGEKLEVTFFNDQATKMYDASW